MNHSQLKENINNFSLNDGSRGNQGYSRVLLQIFGLPGHGKSSLINSCKYVLDEGGPFAECAKVGHSGRIETIMRRSYQLTDNITLVDNRGFPKMNYFETAEVYAQLGNFLPLEVNVEWRENYQDVVKYVEESEMDPNESDLIIPIFVYSARDLIPEQGEAELSTFMRNCQLMTGIYPVVVLTNRHSRDLAELERTFRRMQAEVVIAIENYTKDDHTKTLRRTVDILRFIDSALKNAKYLMEQPRNPKKDRIERRMFLLNHIHNAVLVKEEKRVRREEEQRAKRKPRKTCFWDLFKPKK